MNGLKSVGKSVDKKERYLYNMKLFPNSKYSNVNLFNFNYKNNANETTL